MSNPGRAEAATKPIKKKKKDLDATLSKAIGKLHIPKKGKKKEDGPGTPEKSKSPKASPIPQVKLADQSGKVSDDFLKNEVLPHTSTPVKKVEAEPVVESPLTENAKLKEAEGTVSPVRTATYSEVAGNVDPAIPKDEETETKPDDVLQKISSVLKEKEDDEDADSTSMDTATSTEHEAPSGLKRECLYKILVIGELGTGKTSIIKRYVHQFFSQHYRATIGVDFALKVLNWDQNTIIRLQLWDIAGQERFGNMTRVYYKEAVGAFIVFDVTRAATFDAVVKWKQDLDAKVQLPDGSPIPCVLLANKCDQQKEGIVNNPNKMNEYCEEHKFTAWFETSAKENINIEEAAKTLVDQIVHNDSSSENGRNGARDLSKFPLESTEDFTDGKSCSC